MWRLRSGSGRARSLLAGILTACVVGSPVAAEVLHYPKLFGSHELYSTEIARFPHWVAMLERLRTESAGCDTFACTSDGWNSLIAELKGKPLGLQLREVNNLINAHRYVRDDENWSDADYWATPHEFLKKSGDCEDFAITKYMALRALGIPVQNVRVVVLWNSQSNSGHAALVVYAGNDAFLLDNLIPAVVRAGTVDHYRAIYSINETGWWLHKNLIDPVPQISSAHAQRDSGG